MTDSLNRKSINNSIGVLYSKGKSKENALIKIETFLKTINFDENLEFTQSCCSLKYRDQPSQTLNLTQQEENQ